jgi:ADP-ribose pyrophosphatase YjhB (NUDIX family)
VGFCYQCGNELVTSVPEGDDQERELCPECGYVHYVNPRILVGVFLFCDERLFWIKRGTEPNKGRWTFPGGFLEQGESLQQAAARELEEETGIAKPSADMTPFSMLSLPAINQVYLSFHCRCDEEIAGQVTAEAADWGWYAEGDAPWAGLAYPGVEAQVHKTYFWLREGRFPFRVGEITDGKVLFNTYSTRL